MPNYNIVANTSVWCYHRMAPTFSLSGEPPRTATTNEANTFPAVKGGRATYSALTKGGLFTLVANARRPLIVEAVDNPGTATLTLVDRNDLASSRAMPSVPFHVSGSEVIKATGGAAGSYVGFLYRIEGERVQ